MTHWWSSPPLRTIILKTGCKKAHFYLKIDHGMALRRERRLIEHSFAII